MFMNWNAQSVLFSILTKLTYRFYVIQIKLPADLFVLKKLISRFNNAFENAKYLKEKINLKKTNKIEELILFDFKTYCEAIKGVE